MTDLTEEELDQVAGGTGGGTSGTGHQVTDGRGYSFGIKEKFD